MKNHRLLVIKSSLGQKNLEICLFLSVFDLIIKKYTCQITIPSILFKFLIQIFFRFYLSWVFRKILMLSKILKSNIRFSINLNCCNVYLTKTKKPMKNKSPHIFFKIYFPFFKKKMKKPSIIGDLMLFG